MLDTDTKRRIDAARDILVGKVPDPKSQVEQITLALLYKFMDDIDRQSEELGGKRTFFVDDFARFGWAELMKLGGNETLNLYAEGIVAMPENPGIPPLFRDIFKNAFLPYRDPETLKHFLKVIDEFEYDHSERLGDAFEYLLSVLGSQGDAGQFRTPRHIIDFMVAVIDPKKDETILDPACGTAGFLISSYKHIQTANQDERGQSTLTPDERKRLANNLKGYDISPDMVRLSRANMYLHGFVEPHIFEYDTLTTEDRWNERADVILANPPFMSPKGGIRPHNRFSVKSKRSEVLFTDYIAEHLTPVGRAAVIVPEGIIFQSQNAHKQLRRLLVENYLVAVVSLPAGVFNPYSGVKTSILILDRPLAKKTDRIAFFKVEQDGFDLGAKRTPIDRNDLPRVCAELTEYLNRLRVGEPAGRNVRRVAEPQGEIQRPSPKPETGMIAEKAKIVADGEYNLSGERYRESETRLSHFPLVEIGTVAEVFNGITSKKSEYKNSGLIKVIKVKDFDEDGVYFDKDEKGWIDREINTPKYLKRGDTLMINAAHSASHVASKIGFLKLDPPFKSLPSGEITIFRAKDKILALFLNKVLTSPITREKLKKIIKGIHIYPKDIKCIQIPLPPLEVQQSIVAEIKGYQNIIDGAQAVLDHYRPRITVDPKWPMVCVGQIAKEIKVGFACGKGSLETEGVPHIRPMNVTENGQFTWRGLKRIGEEDYLGKKDYALLPGDVLFNNTNSKELVGKTCLIVEPVNGGYSNHMTRIRVAEEKCVPSFLAHILHDAWRKGHFYERANKWIGQAGINSKSLSGFQIPLPPLKTQQAIVAEIEAEQSLVNANRELIERMQNKIQTTVARVWDGNA